MNEQGQEEKGERRAAHDACRRMLVELGNQDDEWARRHLRAWLTPDSAERALRDLIVGLGRYGVEHQLAHSQQIGEDGYLGPVFETMARSLLALLNGDIRRFDGGTLDGLIRDIGRENGFDAEAW